MYSKLYISLYNVKYTTQLMLYIFSLNTGLRVTYFFRIVKDSFYDFIGRIFTYFIVFGLLLLSRYPKYDLTAIF